MVLGAVWGRGEHTFVYSGLQSSDQSTRSPASGALLRAQTGLQALTVRAGQAEHPECSRHLASSCLSIDFCQTVRNIRCHIQGYFLEIEVERALEIIVEKSLEMFLTLNLPSCVLFLTFNISSFPTMGLWAPHPLSNTSSVRGLGQQSARY